MKFPWLSVLLFGWLVSSKKKKRTELDPENPLKPILRGDKGKVQAEINYLYAKAKFMHDNLEDENLDPKVALKIIGDMEGPLKSLKKKMSNI